MYFYETNTLKCDVPANVAAGSGLTRGERNGPHIIKATGGILLYPVKSICSRLITSSSSKCTLDKNTCKAVDLIFNKVHSQDFVIIWAYRKMKVLMLMQHIECWNGCAVCTLLLNRVLLMIGLFFVYGHFTRRWAVLDNTHGKDSDAFHSGPFFIYYHGPSFFINHQESKSLLP